MAVGDDHRATSSARRANVIRTLRHQLDPDALGSAAQRWRSMLQGEVPPHTLLMSGDIDGLVSAMMLGAVTPWRIGAVIMGSDYVLLHPSWDSPAHLVETASPFGVDVFATSFPSVSNHPVLWGSRRLAGSKEAGQRCLQFDDLIRERAALVHMENPSLWAGIEASVTDTKRPTAASYRYPLGTAQFLLALLEAAGKSPRLFDREYLPWLIANCDGGVETIRAYPFNVPMWWSSLGAAVGPGSVSEAIYRLVTEQRPNEFVDVDRRLRYEEESRAALALDQKWNLRGTDANTLAMAVGWISDISGWPDPFLGGVTDLSAWNRYDPQTGLMQMNTLPAGGVVELDYHLTMAAEAIHSSFSFFDGKWRLGWMASV